LFHVPESRGIFAGRVSAKTLYQVDFQAYSVKNKFYEFISSKILFTNILKIFFKCLFYIKYLNKIRMGKKVKKRQTNNLTQNRQKTLNYILHV